MATLTGSSNCAAGTFTINFTATANENSSSVDNINNTSKVNWSYRVYVTSNNVSFSGHTRNHAGIFVFTINGTQVVNKYTGMPNGMGNGTTLIEGSGTTNAIAHSSNGTKTISISAEIIQSDDDYGNYIYYWQSTGLKTGSVTLTSIDRTAATPSFSSTSKTYNSISVNVKSSFATTSGQYSLNGGSTWTSFSCNVAANGTWSNTFSGLSPNTAYNIQVKFKRNYNGIWSSACSTSVTTDKPAAPSKGSVTVSSTTYNSITYSWSRFSFGAGATWGEYQISFNGGAWTSVGTNTSYTASNLSHGTSYTLNVRLKDNYNQYSGESSVTGTTTETSSPTAGTISVSNITPFGATFSWSGFNFGTGATWGKYQYGWHDTEWYDCGQSTSITLSDRKPNTSNTFYVRLVDNYGKASPNVTVVVKTLKPTAPTAGTILVKNITHRGATLFWDGFAFGNGADFGKYQYNYNGSWIDCGTDTTVTLKNLSSNASYTFKVRLIDNYGTASNSVSITFKTKSEESWKYVNQYIKVNGTWKYGIVYYKVNGVWKTVTGTYFKGQTPTVALVDSNGRILTDSNGIVLNAIQ